MFRLYGDAMLERARTTISTISGVLLIGGLSLAFLSTMAIAPSFAATSSSRYTDPRKDAALIVDGETGKVLYSRNANAQRYPASLTKMMTLYMLFDALHRGQVTMRTPIPISSHAAAQQPTKLGLRPGSTIKVEDAIKAVVIHSSNDIAVAIAEKLGGTEANFAKMMTRKAHAMGMGHTQYHNASGLPDRRQITTASDLVILARHLAYDYPQYFHYFGMHDFTYRGRRYTNHNHLIGKYKGADGIKTGYTNMSGFNLVSSVVRDGAHIIAVVMGGRSYRKRDTEMVKLLDQTFARIEKHPQLVARAEVPWQNIASDTGKPIIAGFQLGPAAKTRALAVASLVPRPSPGAMMDEETAESALLPDDPDNVIAAAPRPQPRTVLAAYHPQGNVVTTPTPRNAVLRNTDTNDVFGSAKKAGKAGLGSNAWTIQIGAYGDITSARTELAAYAEKSMDMLGQASRIVVPFQSVDGHTLYRARFGPFAEREARKVCSRLTERGQTCFAAVAMR